MTVAAIAVFEREILAWADSEVFVGDAAVSWHKNKICVNVLAGIVGVGAGVVVVTDVAALAVMNTSCFDEAVQILPDILRDKYKNINELAPEFCFARDVTTFAIAGFFPTWKMNIICVFSSQNNFVPRFVREWASPPFGWEINADMDIGAAARRQLHEIRTSYPGARGGALVVARLRGGEAVIRQMKIFEGSAAAWLGSSAVADGSAGAAVDAPAERA